MRPYHAAICPSRFSRGSVRPRCSMPRCSPPASPSCPDWRHGRNRCLARPTSCSPRHRLLPLLLVVITGASLPSQFAITPRLLGGMAARGAAPALLAARGGVSQPAVALYALGVIALSMLGPHAAYRRFRHDPTWLLCRVRDGPRAIGTETTRRVRFCSGTDRDHWIGRIDRACRRFNGRSGNEFTAVTDPLPSRRSCPPNIVPEAPGPFIPCWLA